MVGVSKNTSRRVFPKLMIPSKSDKGSREAIQTWTTGVAYTASTLFYQIATFSRHPTSSVAWIVALGLILLAAIAGLRIWSGRGRARVLARAEAEA